jgi:hypothetical protein
MLVSEAISRIRFQTNTNDDNTGRNANALFSNKNLVAQFQICLDQYAAFTKGIEDIFSHPLGTNVRSIDGPSDVIRGEGYRFIYLWRGGRRYSINIKDLNFTQTRFPYQTYSGIPQFVTIWNDEIYFYPDASVSFETTSTTADVGLTDTSITVASTADFPDQNGRITIGDEKILYQSKVATQFQNCTRGIENTTPALHSTGAVVNENNLMVFYNKRVKKISVDSSDIVFPEDMGRELPIAEEHMISIINLTTYMLLQKVDAVRAEPYKIDAVTFLNEAKKDIEWGRSNITSGQMISSPFDFEINNSGVTF